MYTPPSYRRRPRLPHSSRLFIYDLPLKWILVNPGVRRRYQELLVYLDGVLVFGQDFDTHCEWLDLVLKALGRQVFV